MYSIGVAENSGHQGVAVETVAARTARNAAEQQFHQLEILVVLVGAAEDEVRRGAVAGRHRQMRRALAERARPAVEEARMRVEAVRQRGRELRVEQRAFRQHDLEEVVEAFVEVDRRVEGHDHVDAEEQLAQAFVDMEVDRAGAPGRRCR